jgi:cardiolipin-specific phospholipase
MSESDSTVVEEQAKKNEGGPTYKESFKQWLFGYNHEKAEKEVISLLPFYPESDGTRQAEISQVSIGNKQYLNQLKIQNTEAEPSEDKTLVVMHGYGAGLAFFFRNFDAWSSIPGSTTYALDWLGYGRSSRPKFKVRSNLEERDDSGVFPAVVETENFFVDSLEQWRKATGLKRFTLMGHSLGGYLACVYAMKYPEHVERLILISPAGVELGYTPELETKKYAPVTVPRGARFEEELTVSQEEIHEGGAVHSGYNTREWAVPALMVWLWNRHVSPFSIVRMATFLGPRVVGGWSYRRFNDLPRDQMEKLHMYVYRTFMAKPSGEYGLTRILAPGVVPRMPLLKRAPLGLKCPSLWVYGDSDWMNVYAGKDVVERINKARDPRTKAEFRIVPEAGHHTYLDNPEAFDRMLLKWLGDTPLASKI